MTRQEKINEILDRVSEGVWNQHNESFFVWSQCAFCCVSPDSEHYVDCPVKLAKELRDEMDEPDEEWLKKVGLK